MTGIQARAINTMTAVAMRPVRTNLVLRGLGLPLLVEVHGEERGAGVEHAGQRAHQRREQPGHHDAPQARRQQVLDHQREGGLRLVWDRLAVGATIAASAGTLPLLASAKQIRPGMMNR